MSRRPEIFRWALVSVALALTVCLVPGSPGALELFLPVRVPLIIPRIPLVPLNERVIRIPMTLSRPSGGQAEFVMLPPCLEEEHYLFPDVRGLARWTPVVNRFLNDLGFPGMMPRP